MGSLINFEINIRKSCQKCEYPKFDILQFWNGNPKEMKNEKGN
jgi:hypothetical protein